MAIQLFSSKMCLPGTSTTFSLMEANITLPTPSQRSTPTRFYQHATLDTLSSFSVYIIPRHQQVFGPRRLWQCIPWHRQVFATVPHDVTVKELKSMDEYMETKFENARGEVDICKKRVYIIYTYTSL
jgi:hypothetical protein